CSFLGVQDTINDDDGCHYYNNCYIQGSTDLIYGNGQSLFEASTIYFSKGKSSLQQDGVITAQYRDSPNDPSGFVFKNCNISGTGYKTQLGRPMGAYARVIIANSYLSDVVRPEGWSQLTYVGHEQDILDPSDDVWNTLNSPVLLDATNITQARAAKIHADKCAFYSCSFLGVQDTLNDDYGRHYYNNCYIQGAADFIYGRGQSLFEASTIYFSPGKSGLKNDGVITAQYRESPNDPSGFVFKNCNITGTGGKFQLGRAMEAYARVIIANSYISDAVRPEGWNQTTYVGHESNLTFAEEGCTGPGADKTKRVKWMKNLSRPELDKFL
ncbi:hypothetical protein RYX36_023918, partial [Vicia faba]